VPHSSDLKPLPVYLKEQPAVEDTTTEMFAEYGEMSVEELASEHREVAEFRHQTILTDDWFAASCDKNCPLGKSRKPLRQQIRDCDLRMAVLLQLIVSKSATQVAELHRAA
jgi:hypothetical protein